MTFALAVAPPAVALTYEETPYFAERVAKGELPPVAERVPAEPLVVDLAAKNRMVGTPGGDIVSLVSRARDIRYMSANAYARLVGYNERLELLPDLLERAEVDEARVFT
ncbi:MAG: ABC transporter substrate-binding protein, partial [Pseudomonadota bacterium]|nr:ABC transporter substrate-binding protein [Pseudomonadota bacterium]